MTEQNEIKANDLDTLRLPELQARFAAVVGETTKSPNRKFLIRRIEEALAAQTQPAAEQETRVVPEESVAPEAKQLAVAPAELSACAAEEPAPQADAELAKEPSSEEPTEAELEPEGKCPTNGDECVGCDACEPTEAQPEQQGPATENEPLVGEQAGAGQAANADAAPAAEGANAEAAPASAPAPKRGRFAAMTIAELQAKYTEVVGRSTNSEHRGYLIWKIREAEKGRITVGPVHARKAEGEPADVKILPLRLETKVVDAMDAAWRERGIKNRMEFFRRAIGAYLTQLGATEAAALFAGE